MTVNTYKHQAQSIMNVIATLDSYYNRPLKCIAITSPERPCCRSLSGHQNEHVDGWQRGSVPLHVQKHMMRSDCYGHRGSWRRCLMSKRR